MSLNNQILALIEPIKQEFLEFEYKLSDSVEQSFSYYKKEILDFLFNDSKRLRPIFVILFSKILKIDNIKDVLNIAVAQEIVHNASLIHDDILDCEKVRKNKITFCEKYNSKIAVLVGDYLLSLALKILSDINSQVVKIFSEKIKSTIEAEFMQAQFLNKVLDEQQYFDKTFNKTANIFLCGVESLFAISQVDDFQKKVVLAFMTNFSIAFQIKNDIENIKKNKMTDLTNGNYTLPVLYYLKNNSLEELNSTKDKIFALSQYLKQADECVEKYKKEAFDYLKRIDDSKYKTAVIRLSDYILRS